MSNNTTLTIREAGSLFLSEPYLLWLEKDVFPYIFGTTSLLIILTGILFNTAICKLFWNEVHVGIRRTIYQCVVVDVLAVFFVLAPGMFISFSKLDDISEVYCVMNGVLNLSTTLIQFGALFFGLVISYITLLQGTFKSGFHTRCKHVCSIIGLIVFCFIFALIPISWSDGYLYLTSEYMCGPNRSLKKAYINVVFVIGLIPPFCLTIVLSIALLKKLLVKNTRVSEIPNAGSACANSDENPTMPGENSQMSMEKRNRFKSDDAVSIEDQTRSYLTPEIDGIQSRRNRFTSDVTVSMEDHTRSYNNFHFKDPSRSGVTISMEDKTRSFITKANCQDSELAFIGKQNDEIEYSFRKSSSTYSSLSATDTVLDKVDIGTLNSENACIKETDNSNGNDYKTSGDSVSNNPIRRYSEAVGDDKISFDYSYGSRPETPIESEQKRHRMKTNGNRVNMQCDKKAENRNLLTSLPNLTHLHNDMTVKFVTTNVIISFAVITCWIPFVIMVYIEMYGNSWWNGWLTLAVLFANMSYCIKPIMILGMRGQLIKASKAVLPKSVGDRADRVASVVTSAIDKFSKRLS